jgi:DNA gyrase subunit A
MAETIVRKSLGDALAPRYKSYAQETLEERAIPDIRDGLKPVHLRILYCMYHDLGLTHSHKTIKSAKVTGAVLGSYHPHGSASVYDAMIGLVQDWTMRYPLIELQGNPGNIDGDGPAADRYTECRLTRIGEALMKDIDKGFVETRPNYDDTTTEPVVASGLIANALINATNGIACGFSTTMASHNLTEVYDALDYILAQALEDNDADVNQLTKIIKGPDFPTGGVIVDNSEWHKIFTEGKGKVVLRAKHEIISNKKQTIIQISEIPFGINKLKLVNSIEQKIESDQLSDIKEVIDASSEGRINIQIILKKGANPDLVLNNLFAKTDLQSNFNYNMVTLLNKKLQQSSSILDCLYDFINHGLEIVKKRAEYDLAKVNKRLHMLEGLLIVLHDLDRALELIRVQEDPKQALEALYGLDTEQSEYILDMKIRRINNQDVNKLQLESDELLIKKPFLESIINDEKVTLGELRKELADIKEKFGDDRKTVIDILDKTSIAYEDLIEEEDLVITVTSDGNIKSVSASEYNSQRRGGKGNKGAKVKDDEIIVDSFSVRSKDDLIFVTNTGRAHTIKAYAIQKTSKTGKGKNIVNYLKLEADEYPVSTLAANLSDTESFLTIVTKLGTIKRIGLDKLSTKFSYTNIMSLEEGDDIVKAVLTKDGDEVMIVSDNGLYVRFPIETVRPMGRTAMGVKGIEIKDDNRVLTMVKVTENDEVVTVSEKGIGKRTSISEYPASKNRGGKGYAFYKPTDRTGKVTGVITLSNNEDILVTTINGQVIRIKSDCISLLGRVAQGVKLINLSEDDTVSSIAKIIASDNEGDDDNE